MNRPFTAAPAGASDWLVKAACLQLPDPDVMYPDNKEAHIAAAKRVCGGCPVLLECLEDALRTDELDYGIRGGLRPHERRALAKKRSAANPAAEPEPPLTLEEAVARHLTKTATGHFKWAGPRVMQFCGVRFTSTQAAFTVGHGRPPVGKVTRTCGHDCFTADHLVDSVLRTAHADCGTRPGYRRHRDRNEPVCDPCRKANTDSYRRYRATGTTKALA